MINLLIFAAENSRINKLISSVSEIKGHQGTIIRFADEFLMMFNLWKNDSTNFIRIMDYYFEFLDYRRFRGSFSNMEMLHRISSSYPLGTYTKIIDFGEWRKFENEILRRYSHGFLGNYFRPLELIISIFNDSDPKKFNEIINEYNSDEYESNVPEFKVILEKRSRNVFLGGSRKYHSQMVGGVSIGNNSKRVGTLGGILSDENGNYFGLTCAHVTNIPDEDVFQPALIDSREYRKIGQVRHSGNINWTDDNSPCNPRFLGRSGIPTNMDATLISLNPDILSEKRIHNLGRVKGEKKFDELYQHMEVEFNGRTTGFRKRLVIGGVCVSYKIAYDGDDEDKLACFTNLIELRNPYPIMNAGNYNLQKSPVSHGDSGSWICSNDSNGYNWCGMLISGDIDRGYFIAAEDIQDYLKDNNFNLKCSKVNIGISTS